MAPERWLTVPNAITLFRMSLVPVFVVLDLTGRPGWALGCFAIAAVSDVIDGLLARLLRQRSKLGGILDPIADKVLVGAALLTLVVEARLPFWLFLLVMFREGWIAFGVLVVKRKHLDIPVSPSRVGKYATVSLSCLIVLALTDQVVRSSEQLHAYMVVLGFIAALCVVISTLQYFVRFGFLFFAPPRSSS